MLHLTVLALVGLVAQLIDGALGMAYGTTTSTLLLAVGMAPVLASATTHLAEVGTTLVAGIAHHRFRNVDWRVVAWLGFPGGAGALLGAVVLTRVDATLARPFMSAFLLVLGLYTLIRSAADRSETVRRRRLPRRLLAPLGLVAGWLDAAGGGGWGPLGTSTLLASRRMEPRTVVGTIDTSEFLVAACASAGFLVALQAREVPWTYVGAVLGGGIVAAPLAAWIVRKANPRLTGVTIGTVLVATNLHNVARAVDLEPAAEGAAVASVVLGAATLLALGRARRERRTQRET
jgi:hypothetical protein